MESLFDQQSYNSIKERLNQLTSTSARRWGKMDVAQMLAHCQHAFDVPLSKQPLPRPLVGKLLGWMFKAKLYNDSPWRKNLPTAPSFVVKESKNFAEEKEKLEQQIDSFYSLGKGKVGLHPHPIFGSFTDDQWGQSMYKHLDHHFKQFGV